jgi:diguanylate cyclase (GGDEF)-like protein
MDQAFYVRMMILAGAMAFVVSSTAVYLRVFLAYCLPIGLLLLLSLLVLDHVQPKSVFVVSISLYMMMLCGQALSINRSVRDAILSHQRVLQLTQDLNSVLVSERALREEVKQLSLTDELTGIFNRRGITENLEVEVARSRRLGTPLSLLMLDIDRFKPINDTFGHATGDEVIRTVAQALKKELRETDVLGRFGGDEFIVVLPALELEGAIAAAHRLRQSVQFSAIEMLARGVSITISVGVATCRPTDSTVHLMSRADGALYAAKENGRNRIEPER